MLPGGRVYHHDAAGDPVRQRITAAREFARHVRGMVRSNVRATFETGDIEQPCFGTVGSGPEIAATRNFGTHSPRTLVLQCTGRFGVQLQILGGIVIDGLASFRINAFGPGHLGDILAHLEKLPGSAVKGVIKSIASRMRDGLAILPVDLGVDQHMRAGFVVVAIIVRRVLKIPFHFAGCHIKTNRARRIQIVAGAACGIVAGHRITGAPDGQIGLRIVRAGDVERATARFPGFVFIFPGFAAGLARRGNRVSLPF